jgi:hypothetical protein
MSANPGSKNFDDLQKLLALKRHEQPPQRFFTRFTHSVLENLNTPERRETMSWLQRLGVHFDLSPAVVGAIGLVVCTLLAMGMSVAMKMDKPPPPVLPIRAPNTTWEQPAAEADPPSKTVAKPDEVPKSTAPVITPDSSPFDARATKAGFNTPAAEK